MAVRNILVAAAAALIAACSSPPAPIAQLDGGPPSDAPRPIYRYEYCGGCGVERSGVCFPVSMFAASVEFCQQCAVGCGQTPRSDPPEAASCDGEGCTCESGYDPTCYREIPDAG